MFTRFRQDIASRGHRLHQDVTRTSTLLRQARDQRFLDRVERPRCAARIADLVARYNGVTLNDTTIQRGFETYRLDGVRATVRESRERTTDLGSVRDVDLVITGPDFEWTVKTVAVFSSRRVRSFAALINSYALRQSRVLVH
ncbi:MAG TPA: hypothetical protein VFE65_13660 [Pseudonocardia sp.]|jgi:hypothetical protein|nr:hypothetical protein [Pseudonocardia sp.]